jgi:septin family protein
MCFTMELTHPFTMIIAGPTGCGKTVFTNKLLESDLFSVEFTEIIWCYSEIGSLGTRNPNITYIEGLPSE